MRNALLTGLIAAPLLAACTTDPYTGRPDIGTRIGGGALVGAAVGALAGPAVGANAITGAAAGMVAGGAIGAATTAVGTHRHYYRDTQGYCYYVDASGKARYNKNVTC